MSQLSKKLQENKTNEKINKQKEDIRNKERNKILHVDKELKDIEEGGQPVIKAIGVGGGGCNMITYMKNKGLDKDIELYIVNTDAQVLKKSPVENKIFLSSDLTRGLGAGMQPEKGRTAAEASIDKIKNMLKDADIAFIAAGMGGGTGTGASSVIAQVAKEMDVLTIAVVTLPFQFEGKKRRSIALEGLEELKEHVDAIIVINNQNIFSLSEKNLSLQQAFHKVDDVLYQAIHGLTDIILSHSDESINLDFADIKTIMTYKGNALIGIGNAAGEESALNAFKMAITSPLLEQNSIDGAKGLIVHFTVNNEYPINQIKEAMDYITEYITDETQLIFGTSIDKDIASETVKVTIIATGVDGNNKLENKKHQQNSISKNSSTEEQLYKAINNDGNEIVIEDKSMQELLIEGKKKRGFLFGLFKGWF